MHHRSLLRLALGAVAAVALIALTLSPAIAATKTYDITTLAGKVASLRGTAGLQVRFSGFVEQEAEESEAAGEPAPATPITPDFVLDSPLDHNSITPPNVRVNQDTHGAPQNETSIAVDPNNPDRIVASANDYTSRTWSCDVDGTPCSALGEGYSGTFFSNNGGATWCCASSGPNDLGTLIPGVNHLGGGIYDAAGDPSVAFDSQGHVFYAGLGFDRTAAPNTVEVSKGTFDGGGNLSWGDPTWINPTTSPSVLNDKEWIAVDSREGSQFQDRIYVSWTRFLFNAHTGAYTQSPIAFVYSTDGGATFSTPVLISGSVLYGQGSHVTIGPDGEVYVFWNGSTRLASLDGEYMVKSTDGGVTWSKPKQVSTVADTVPLRDTAFRVNSYPMATVDPTTGDVYDVWSGEVPNDASTYSGTNGCAWWLSGGASAVQATCHSAVVYSKSTNGGATWSAPTAVFAQGDRTAAGYPVTNPDSTTLQAPAPRPIEDVFPSAASGANGRVYVGAYRGATVSPWQTCDPAHTPAPPEGRINCEQLGNYIDNTRLDYVVADLTTATTNTVSTWPINSRYGFGGGFFGDYTDIAVGSDGVFHALYTDTNDEQTVTWFYGLEFTPTDYNQEDIVTATGSY